MPTRLIREGILESQRVNRLSEEEENFYRRLMSRVDDYGRYEANTSLLRAHLYPLKLDAKNEAKIAELLNATVRARLVFTYLSDGKVFLQLLEFRQQTRSESKYPCPDAKQLKTFVNTPFCPADAKQPLTGVHLVGGVDVVGGVCGVVVVDGAEAAQPTTTTVARKERKPTSVESVISYGASLGVSEEECRRFFEYNLARRWRVPAGEKPDWQALLGRWRECIVEPLSPLGKKRFGGATEPFDPAKPNAHTGGLAVVN